MQPVFYSLQASDPDIIFTDRLQDIEQLTSDPCLIICDDQMDNLGKRGADVELLTKFYIQHSHHRGASIILILQNAFKPLLRDVNLNTQYLFFFDQPRDRSTISTLARQLCPGQGAFLQQAYQKAVEGKEFGYLFLDLHPRNKLCRFWVRSNVFPTSDCELYLP